jgi:competence protein ComEC
MAEDRSAVRTKPRLLSAIALERLATGKAARSGHPAISNEDLAEHRPSAFCRTREALLRSVENSLAMGNGPAWLVFGLGAGLIGYFALPYEPALWALYPAAIALGLLAWRARLGVGFYSALMALFVVLGVVLGAQTARLVDAPQILTERVDQVTGRVVRVEQRTPTRARLTVDQLTIEGLPAERKPERIRITVIADAGTITPGDEIDVLARLGQPPEPVMPGARNMRRELYFDGIGATGFSYGRPSRIERGADDRLSFQSVVHAVERTRQALAARFSQTMQGDTGALAATLLVGKRDGLSEESYEALRRAGLAHLLAISGMHMAMMTLSAIAMINLVLALHPSMSTSQSVMRWAALAGLIIASGYLVLSGASTATQRAFVMIVIVLVAMMTSRRALTIRGVAFAALIVLLLHPESILGPSFQMSFAATLALVAFYGAFTTSPWVWQMRASWQTSSLGPMVRPISIVSGIALTSLVAGLATAPFAAYHFSVGAPLGLLGNVLALPLVSLIIMPAGLIALFLTPFALEAPALTVMGFGIDAVMVIAQWVASFDGSRVAIAAITPHALLLLTLSGCLAAFFTGRARLTAGLPLVALPFLGVFQPVPIILVERNAATVGHVSTDVEANVSIDRSIARGSRFSVEMWGQRLAIDGHTEATPTNWTCDPLGCVLTLQGGETLAHVLDAAALEEDCRLASIIVSPLRVPESCQTDLIIDQGTLQEHGATALIRTNEGGLAIWPSFARRTRPWEQISNQTE